MYEEETLIENTTDPVKSFTSTFSSPGSTLLRDNAEKVEPFGGTDMSFPRISYILYQSKSPASLQI
jgi:hypothetical protein